MRQIFLGVIFAMVAYPAFATEWVLIEKGMMSGKEYTSYYEKGSLVRHGDVVDMWLKMDIDNVQTQNGVVTGQLSNHEYDCANRAQRMKSGTLYLANTVPLHLNEAQWVRISPNTGAETVLDVICAIDKQPRKISSQDGCSFDDIFLVKAGNYGAVNLEIYRDMEHALKVNNSKALKLMLKDKSLIKLSGGVKACLVTDSPAWYRKQVRIDGFDVPYWVSNDSLTKVE